MNYKNLNISLGWLAFLIATIVYFLTVEETASLWDCGEYITAAYKLEVGHPPGAPFFMLIGRLFTFFAEPENVALWINRMSALCSSFTILFLFWSITLLGRKIALKDGENVSKSQEIAILGSGFVGALAYTFTDSFWFSAVEGEVYAMSSLFTAVIFWAALKWDEEMRFIKAGELSPDVRPLRWMVLIMFLFGLAIGVHLLGLLVLPAIAYIVMYNYKIGKEVTLKQFILTGVIGVLVLGFIQEGIIPGTIALASKMEIYFVNTLGLPFVSGAIFFFLLLIVLLTAGLVYTQKKGHKLANTALLGLVMLFIGYGSFTTIVIRSNANTPLDENNPENLVTLHAYLKREQYGSWPLLYGEYFNSKTVETNEYGDRSPFYDKRYVITTPRGTELKAFRDKEMAEQYLEKSGEKYDIVHKYFETNKSTRIGQVPVFAQKTLFPRMFYRGDANRTAGYKRWSGYNSTRKVDRSEIGDDGRPIPTFGNNLTFFVNYQVDWMYWRYFMWNFSGRQNDIQGHGDEMRGNWLSGFEFIDTMRLGAQDENAPYFTSHNFSNNKFYFIPLILGLIGLFFHYIKAPRDAFVVTLLFLFTGLAIVVYLNQKPYEPRERDYAYAASFYAFAIWVGLGVYGLFEAFRSFGKEEYKKLGIVFAALLFLCLLTDFSSGRFSAATPSMLVVGVLGFGSLALMTLFGKMKLPAKGVASLAVAIGLIAPVILGVQGWDDHDRSNRSPARALAWNYLQSVPENGILFTNGDNDTFPLWYLQEVEEIRTDVRVANLSLMQTDWYTEQMMMRAYESDPLPIKFREDQILMGAGNTDYILFIDYDVYSQHLSSDKARSLLEAKIEHNKSAFNNSYSRYKRALVGLLGILKAENEKTEKLVEQIIEELKKPDENPGYKEYVKIDKITSRLFKDINNGNLSGEQQLLNQFQDAATSWMKDWDYLPLDIAMKFVRDDNNMLSQPGGRGLRFFPSKGFILPVHPENAVKSGIIDEKLADKCDDEIRISFSKGGMFPRDVRGLSREEVMMLDILANFEWKRSISFSSPGGSDVSKALYVQGVLQNVGQVHTLSPLSRSAINDDAKQKMYTNLLSVYDYGNLSEEGVLVDYYVRRHTSQYRGSFIDLAIYYVQDYQKSLGRDMDMETFNLDSELDTLGASKSSSSTSGKKKEDAAEKVEEVVRFAMEQLPMDRVLDMGEPRATSKQLPNGSQIYTDGRLTELISTLYQVERIDYANELATEYLDQLETLFNYFKHSHPMIAYSNQEDFIALCMNFLRMFREVYSTNDGNEMEARVVSMEDQLTKEIVPRIVEGLRLIETTETRNKRKVTRRMEREAQAFLELYQALLVENGFMEGD